MNNTLKGMTMAGLGFSSCQKNVLLGPGFRGYLKPVSKRFSSCQKNVLLGPGILPAQFRHDGRFQQLLEECTIGTYRSGFWIHRSERFQQLLEECTIGTYKLQVMSVALREVSVVVRRMYYWDLEQKRGPERQSMVSVVVRRMYYWDLQTQPVENKGF